MGMTMTQKILAAHAGLKNVTAGQLIAFPNLITHLLKNLYFDKNLKFNGNNNILLILRLLFEYTLLLFFIS